MNGDSGMDVRKQSSSILRYYPGM